MEHIRYLSQEIGARPGGLENEERASAYIVEYFEEIGYETQIQSFDVRDQYIGEITVHGAEAFYGEGEWGFDEWHGNVWETGAARNGEFTGEDDKITGEVVAVGSGAEEKWTEEVAGEIALMKHPPDESWWEVDWSVYVERAEESDAAGLMIYSVVGGRGQYGQTFSPIVEADIPVLGLPLVNGMWLQEMTEEGSVEVDIQTWHHEDLTSQNIIATKEAKENDAPIVVVGGHYDSVLGAPGANDNASGSACVMEIARVLNKFNTEEYEIRFALWGDEERGLNGVRYYVNNLSDEELDRHVANYNIDMVATSEYERAPYLFLQTVDGDPNVVTETSLDAAERLDYDDVYQSRFGSSDHVPFHDANIPAAMYIWLGGEGTPQDYTIERFYHTPQDTVEENVCEERLEMVLEISGAAIHDLVRKQVPALDNAGHRN